MRNCNPIAKTLCFLIATLSLSAHAAPSAPNWQFEPVPKEARFFNTAFGVVTENPQDAADVSITKVAVPKSVPRTTADWENFAFQVFGVKYQVLSRDYNPTAHTFSMELSWNLDHYAMTKRVVFVQTAKNILLFSYSGYRAVFNSDDMADTRQLFVSLEKGRARALVQAADGYANLEK